MVDMTLRSKHSIQLHSATLLRISNHVPAFLFLWQLSRWMTFRSYLNSQRTNMSKSDVLYIWQWLSFTVIIWELHYSTKLVISMEYWHSSGAFVRSVIAIFKPNRSDKQWQKYSRWSSMCVSVLWLKHKILLVWKASPQKECSWSKYYLRAIRRYQYPVQMFDDVNSLNGILIVSFEICSFLSHRFRYAISPFHGKI